MPLVLAFIAYALILYGGERNVAWMSAAGGIVLGLAIGAMWAEQRRRVDTGSQRFED